jgi:hypothetical protein
MGDLPEKRETGGHRACACCGFLANGQSLLEHVAQGISEHLNNNDVTVTAFAQEIVTTIQKVNRSGNGPPLTEKTVAGVRDRIPKILGQDVECVTDEEVRIFGQLLPGLFPCHKRVVPGATCRGSGHSPTDGRPDEQEVEELEGDLSGKYPHVVFRVVQRDFEAQVAEMVRQELQAPTPENADIPDIALSGGSLQERVLCHIPEDVLAILPRPPKVMSLNDVRWNTRLECSADFIAFSLSKRIAGSCYGVPTQEAGASHQYHESHMGACRVFLVGCGGCENSFVAHLLKERLGKLPKKFVGDIGYFPLDRDGKWLADSRVRKVLEQFHIYGEPAVLAHRVMRDMPVIVTIDKISKAEVGAAILKGKLANRAVVAFATGKELLKY